MNRLNRRVNSKITALVLAFTLIASMVPPAGPAAAQTSETYEFVSAWPSVVLSQPGGVAIDSTGNLYVADTNNNRIRKFSVGGASLAAWGGTGTGGFGSYADPGQFKSPKDVAIDSTGNLYVADTGNHRIQKRDLTGNWSVIAAGYSRNLGQFRNPEAVAIDSTGNLYVSEAVNHRIQKRDIAGNWSVISEGLGNGAGQVNGPGDIIFDSSGNLYVADTGNSRIQKRDVAGNWSVIAGGYGSGLGQFIYPHGIAIDSTGNLYVVDTYNHRIQKRTPGGSWSVVSAGVGGSPGQFSYPEGIAVDLIGNVYVADTSNSRIQKRDVAGNWSVIAGGLNDIGQFGAPEGVTVDSTGGVYVADTMNNRIQKRTPAGNWSVIAAGSGSNPGQFNQPRSIAIDSSGTIYVVDTYNNRIQKRTPAGVWSVVATDSAPPNPLSYKHIAVDSSGNLYVADPPSQLIKKRTPAGAWSIIAVGSGANPGQFNWPRGIAVDSSGNLYVVDSLNNRIQKRTPAGFWSVIRAGLGGNPGQFSQPRGIAVDVDGNLFVADTGNNRIQKLDANGNVLAIWGKSGSADGYFQYPTHIAVDAAGHVYMTDTNNHRVQEFRLGAPSASLPAPSQLSAVAVSDGRVDLTWQDNSTGEDSFIIERKVGAGGAWQQIAVTGGDQIAISDTSAQPSTTYYYRVKALVSYNWNESAWSNEANATTHPSTLKGKVTDSVGNPVAGAKIFAYNTTVYDSYWNSGQTDIFSAGWADHWTQTDASGNYTFTQQIVPAGNYKLRVVPPVGYLHEWHQDQSDYGAANPAILSAASQNINFVVAQDTQPPTGSMEINAGAPVAYFAETDLNVSATDNDFRAVSKMRFSNDGVAWSNWEPYKTIKKWILTAGSGPRTVWAQFIDQAGNISAQTISDDIDLQSLMTNINLGANTAVTNGERVAAIGWPRTITIKADVACLNPNSVKAIVPTAFGPTTVDLSYINGQWQAQVNDVRNGEITLIIDCPSTGEQRAVIGRIRLIDPSGYVTDQVTGLPVSGAAVSLFRLNPETALFEFMDPAAGDNSMLMEPDLNPQLTNIIGYYGWDVAPGTYYVAVHRDGYVDVDQSRIVEVPPPVTDLDIQMVDNLAPTAPALSGAAAGATQIDLAWTPATDAGSGVAGYRIINADTSVPVAQTTETVFSLSGLEPGTSYNYYVKAFDAAGNESAPSNSVAITTPMPTNLALSGDTSGDYSDNAAVSAVLTDANGSPLFGKQVLFTLGTQEATAVTDALGQAQASVKLSQTAGPKEISVDFAGDGYYLASQAQAPFEITKETLSVNYSGDLISQRHQAPALKAKLAEGDASLGDLSGKPVVFTIGNEIATQTVAAATDGNGLASTTSAIDLPAGVYKITADFAGDDYYRSIETSPSTFVVWEPIAGLSAKGSGRITKAGVKKAEFGFNIKYPKTSPYPKGEFEYEEEFRDASGKEKEIELESTAINWLVVSDGLAIFDGQAAFEHQSGVHTFRVFAVDNGKPGADSDTFELYLDGLPFASGTLVKGDVIVDNH